jgi:hypothetical protein
VVTNAGTVLFQSLTSWEARDANDQRDLYLGGPFGVAAPEPDPTPGPGPAPEPGPAPAPATAAAGAVPAAPIAPGPRPAPAAPAPLPPRAPLTLGMTASRISAVVGRRVRIGVRLSRSAAVRVTISRGGRRVALLRRSLRSGRSTITWSARSRGRFVRPGRYTIVVRAISASGQRATGRVRITVRSAAGR